MKFSFFLQFSHFIVIRYIYVLYLFLCGIFPQPDVKKSFIRQLDSILFKLDESSLLLIARLFDPSRSFIKPYLEKAKAALVKR